MLGGLRRGGAITLHTLVCVCVYVCVCGGGGGVVRVQNIIIIIDT